MSLTNIIQQVLSGTGATLLIFFSTLIISMPLGLAVAMGRMSNIRPFGNLVVKLQDPDADKKIEGLKSAPQEAGKTSAQRPSENRNRLSAGVVRLTRSVLFALKRFNPIRLLFQFIISVLRGTPLMLQLFVWFYGPYYVFHIRLTTEWRVAAVILGFSINYAAYFAEIFRSGIQGIPDGQREAAKVLGYSRFQTFFKIIFPQMIKQVLPPVTNEIITLVKDTSLAFVIAYVEVFTIAKQVAAAQTTIVPLFVAGVFYYIFNLLVAGVMGKAERTLNYYS